MSGCEDFHTTGRHAAGLDRGLSRRQVLQLGMGATLGIYGAKAMSMADAMAAAESSSRAAPNAPVLVTIFAPGGMDLLDSLVPTSNYGRYADLRPTLKVTNPVALGSTGVGAHPSLTSGLNGGIKGLYDRGLVGFLPGIDYPEPDLSHFTSRHFWETGILSPGPAPGWLGRWVDRNGNDDNPFQALSLGDSIAAVLRGSRKPVGALQAIGDVNVAIGGLTGDALTRAMRGYRELTPGKARHPGRASAFSAARQMLTMSDELTPLSSKPGGILAPKVAYPQTQTSKTLSSLAAIIDLPLGLRVASTQIEGGFDSHDRQGPQIASGLKTLSEHISAFQADLEARGVADRVITMVWTEFGRRPNENGSAGTDHGAGGVAWLIGPRVKSGILTPYPDLSSFDARGNLKVTADFRGVYASLLEQWLGTGADEVIPGAAKVGRVPILK